MAPHLTAAELDFVQKKDQLGKTPVQIHALLTPRRSRRGVATPDLTNLRKAIKGMTYRRGIKETRGRKQKFSNKWVKTLNTARKKLLRSCAHRREVRWADVVMKARAPKAHRATVKRAFERAGIKVAARRPREKPQRTPEHQKERVRLALAALDGRQLLRE